MPALTRGIFIIGLGTGTLLFLSACRSPQSAGSAQAEESISLLDQKLLEVIKQEEGLNLAAANPDAHPRDIQRMFHQVAREYEGLIARNPNHLESRLLYGKLLSRYGDGEGARIQFLTAAQIDPDIAVIHQQLSKYYAEEEDYTRALAYALNAVRIEPQTAAYHFGLGQLLAAFREKFVEEGVFTRAQLDAEMLRSFSTARTLQPESLPLQFRYGEAFYDVAQPNWEIALAHWQDLAARDDLSPIQANAARVHQARCLSELDRPDEAQAILQQVDPDSFQDGPQPSAVEEK